MNTTAVYTTPTPHAERVRLLSHPDYQPKSVAKVRDAQRPAGLVLTETSATQDGWHLVDAQRARLKRMKQAVITSGRLHQENATRRGFLTKSAMLTLTYRDDVEWSPRHVSDLLERLRKWLKRRGVKACRYVWVLELTKRGRPHYHLIVWLPKGLTMPKPDKQGWWPHGMTKIEWAKRPVGYLAKYASKGQNVDAEGNELRMPDGARIYGVGGLDAAQRDEKAWWLSPGWVRDLWEIEDRPRRAIGGGWFALKTGDWRPSPFEVSFAGGVPRIRRVVHQIVYLDDCIVLDLPYNKVLQEMLEVAPSAGYSAVLYKGAGVDVRSVEVEQSAYLGFESLDALMDRHFFSPSEFA
ncbi:putative phage replication protein [Pseudogulbenkiania sp. NH8B]|uniref:rolling circle replication-associated protein n=1 Tax=Pseudogulbenkiania sp. (strain NH8B) TaxID=748280 RepID=UPI0002279DF1|nr:putative phage replication protein [Pseudogulbenkiania sp. NH8B]BAK77093.1 putative phage replication protein [Pseudogulbenkiania sp. NH8B]